MYKYIKGAIFKNFVAKYPKKTCTVLNIYLNCVNVSKNL